MNVNAKVCNYLAPACGTGSASLLPSPESDYRGRVYTTAKGSGISLMTRMSLKSQRITLKREIYIIGIIEIYRDYLSSKGNNMYLTISTKTELTFD